MILQALYRYYQLLLETEGDQMPGEDYSSADVSFELHLDADGNVSGVIPYVNEKGKSVKRKFIVPKQEKRSSGIQPYFLCDKSEYLFGAAISLREACRGAMAELWGSVLDCADTETNEIRALRMFIRLSCEQRAEQLRQCADDNLLELLRQGGLCVLKYAPTGVYFHSMRTVRQAWENYYSRIQQADRREDDAKQQMCLVTGEWTLPSRIARLHPSIKHVKGAQTAGAALVSFNIASFCSYGRDQSYNAPTSAKAADAYGYVLNRFLSDPKHKARINDTTVVYWAESASGREQDFIASLFQDREEESGEDLSTPDAETIQTRLQGVINRIREGQTFRETFTDLDPNTTFYILGLAPNAARLSVRFWYTGTIGEIGEQVWQHYRDLSIAGLEKSPSIKQLLREIAVGHDWDNIPPNLEGQMLRCILLGLPYSRAMFAQLLNRIRAESDDPQKKLQKIGALRAGMIKAYLLRKARMNKDTKLEGDLTMSLNEQSTSVPYHLGRLFACLEKAQSSALGQRINATIRDRFWGAASATPATVFPRLINLAQHHISKDEEWGKSNDQRIQAVMKALPERFPKRLTLEEQGMFALGYYHQREDLYTKKTGSQN
jgi:CRISPR-associated protein Csd1